MTDIAWSLKGITEAAGQCEHCDRRLGRLFRIADPAGREMTVGRVCARKITGWSWTVREAERLEWVAQRDAKRAAYGSLYTDLVAQLPLEVAAGGGVSSHAGSGLIDGLDRDNVEYARDMLNKSIAEYGRRLV